jgi:hypothetical protein
VATLAGGVDRMGISCKARYSDNQKNTVQVIDLLIGALPSSVASLATGRPRCRHISG